MTRSGPSHLGDRNIMWSTNFPLANSNWPRTQETIERCFEGTSDETRERVLWANAAELYRV